jgi:NTP pyrophosphatase (non-canonical NTP hydrolase)
MDFQQLQMRALEIRKRYEGYEVKKWGKRWTREQVAEGFVGDVGDLMKLVLAKSGVRAIEDVDAKFAHELSDCLWSVIVLANEYGIDLEETFLNTMNELEKKIETLK